MLTACANRRLDSGTSDTGQLEVLLVALNRTVFKESTEQSTQLTEHQKCNVESGEILKIKDESKLVQSPHGPHFKITLLPDQRLRSPCPLETGYVFASHFRQELYQAGLQKSATKLDPNASTRPPSNEPQQEPPRFAWPTSSGVVTSGFGPRYGVMHEGIDIALLTGTPVLASAQGQVLFAGWSSTGYGKLLRLGHAENFETRYAHNSDLLNMAVGKVVLAGDQIARSGDTGKSTGPHLHFEVRTKGVAVDPQRHLPQRGQ